MSEIMEIISYHFEKGAEYVNKMGLQNIIIDTPGHRKSPLYTNPVTSDLLSSLATCPSLGFLTKMARRKLKLKHFQSNLTRRAIDRKEVKGLIEEIKKLSVAYDVDACLVSYGPGDQVPVAWPPSEQEAKQILEDFGPEMDTGSTKLHQEENLEEMITNSHMRLAMTLEEEMKLTVAEFLAERPIEQVPFPNLLMVIDCYLKHEIMVKTADNSSDAGSSAAGASSSSAFGASGAGASADGEPSSVT